MRKRVKIEELRLGMYVSELDRQWPDSPFVTQSFVLESIDQVNLLARHCDHLYIETDLEAFFEVSDNHRNTGFTHLQRPEVDFALLKKLVAPGRKSSRYGDLVTLEEEIRTIQEVHSQAVELIEDLMCQLRQGHSLDVSATHDVVSEFTNSIVRNPDALVCFTRMKGVRASAAQHGLRCCIYALVLGRHLGLEQRQLHDLGIGALLHDIGKTRVPIEILECGYELNVEETRIYRKHVADGVAILEGAVKIPAASVELVRLHHERFDGSGYTSGLSGNEISQFGHIGGIVDVFDGLINSHPGHKHLPVHTALKVMYEQRGKMFHPHLVEEFIRCVGIYPIGSIVEMRSGEVGVVVALNRTRRLKPHVAIVQDPAASRLDNVLVVNMDKHRNRHGETLEIARVLDENVCDFDPSDYLPVVA
ncbi:MAG: HD-GYP domain-containing protein [Acidiferrobacterales bacterium]